MESLPEHTLAELKQIFEDFKQETSSNTMEDEMAQQHSVTQLDAVLDKLNEDSPDYLRVLLMKASLYYEKAKLCLSRSELGETKNYLEEAAKILTPHQDEPVAIFLYLKVINYLSYVHAILGDLFTAKKLLENLVDKEFQTEPVIYCTEELFTNVRSDPTLARHSLKRLLLNNLQMLSWVYGKLRMTERYIQTVHRTLDMEAELENVDRVQWAIRCYRLASIFLMHNRWSNARYHLTAAKAMMEHLEVDFVNNAQLIEAQANLARVWVNYGLQLFTYSRKMILDQIWQDNPHSHQVVHKKYSFHNMQLTLPEVPAREIADIEEARLLFNFTHTWLKRARFYYTLSEFPIQYVNLILELSELYRNLAFFETSIDGQYNVQRKRYETLEILGSLLREVRPNCYLSMSSEIIKELIEAQMELMSLNLKKINDPTEKEELKHKISLMDQLNKKMDEIPKEDMGLDAESQEQNPLDDTGDDVERRSSEGSSSELQQQEEVKKASVSEIAGENVVKSEGQVEVKKPGTTGIKNFDTEEMLRVLREFRKEQNIDQYLEDDELREIMEIKDDSDEEKLQRPEEI